MGSESYSSLRYGARRLKILQGDLLIVLEETKFTSRVIYPLGTIHQEGKIYTCDDIITMTLMVQW